jgi:hypothetical protein
MQIMVHVCIELGAEGGPQPAMVAAVFAAVGNGVLIGSGVALAGMSMPVVAIGTTCAFLWDIASGLRCCRRYRKLYRRDVFESAAVAGFIRQNFSRLDQNGDNLIHKFEAENLLNSGELAGLERELLAHALRNWTIIGHGVGYECVESVRIIGKAIVPYTGMDTVYAVALEDLAVYPDRLLHARRQWV